MEEGGSERILAPRPGVLGVVPVRGSLKPELMAVMEPHLDIDAHLKRHERFLVMDCVCKREMEALGQDDSRYPLKRCGFLGLPPASRSENMYSAVRKPTSSFENSRKWDMSVMQPTDFK